MNTIIELDKEMATARGTLYEFLASWFLKEPSSELINALNTAISELKMIVPAEEGLTELQKFLQNYQSGQLSLSEVQQAYYDLFFVPSSGSFVPPFESAIQNYGENPGKFGDLMGYHTVQVAASYEEIGFNPHLLDIFPPLKQINFPDHLGFELAFMSSLASSEGNLIVQSEFLTNHLSIWIGAFSELVDQNDSTGLYSGVTKIANYFIKQDMLHLSPIAAPDERRVTHEQQH